MRILHTSDWHLTDRLYWVDRQPDIRNRLHEIAAYLEEYRVDVMVVAGDLFSQRNSKMEELRGAVQDVNRIFAPFLRRGGTIVAISGNHDSEALFELLRSAQDLVAPFEPVGSGKKRYYPAGRMYLATKPTCLTLRDGDGQLVHFVLIPYPTAHRYLKHDVLPESVEQKHTLLRSAVLAQLGALREGLDEQYASVLVAHLNVRGSELHNLYKLSEKEDVTFDLTDLPLQWAYVALGHIHKPQSIGGVEHMCYSGSIERMDLGERSDHKSVVYLEIQSGQRTTGPTRLPLHATPIYKFEINDPEREIPALATRFPDAKEALAYYTLRYRPGTHNSNTLIKKINAHFRACCYCESIPEGSEPGSLAEVEQTQVKSVPEQVRSYLEARLLPNDPDRAELLALAEQLLAEGA